MYLLNCFDKGFSNYPGKPFGPVPSELRRTVLAKVCVIKAMLSGSFPLLSKLSDLLAIPANVAL